MYIVNYILFCVTVLPVCLFVICNCDRKADFKDAFLTVPELVVKYGYPFETHYITTEDGYILTLFRIPAKNNENVVTLPILLVHGLIGAASDFIIMGPGYSLAYILSDNNYDVWLLNCRGNRYSTNHTTLDTDSKEYWNFSFHESGVYDVPAAIDYILKNTGHKQLFHIGHSQGCASFYVMLAERPEYNRLIKAHFGYAPAAFICYPMPILRLASIPEKTGFWTRLRLNVGDFNIGPQYLSTYFKFGSLCSEASPLFNICVSLITRFGGIQLNQLNKSYIKVVLGHYPAGASTKQLVHYAQGINSCEFLFYRDFITDQPSKYNLSNVVATVYAFNGEKDGLQSPRDTRRLGSELPNGFKKVMFVPNWGHNDFIFANNAKKKIYDKTIKYIKEELATL